MLKRGPLTLLAMGLLLALITYYVTSRTIIHQAPKTVMTKIENRIAEFAGGRNQCFHNREYGPRKNSIRRANPDSIISSMSYDLSEGPVRISGEIWPRYWSMSLYQQNSDNYFVVNDKELPSAAFDFVLTFDPPPVSQNSMPETGITHYIQSPTKRGVMLIRRFAADETDMPDIIENQNALYCGPA